MSSSAATRRVRSPRFARLKRASGRSSASPTDSRGLSDEPAFWKTICACLRNGLSAWAGNRSRSAPSNSTLPPLCRNSCSSTRPRVDLPQPLSPTRPGPHRARSKTRRHSRLERPPPAAAANRRSDAAAGCNSARLSIQPALPRGGRPLPGATAGSAAGGRYRGGMLALRKGAVAGARGSRWLSRRLCSVSRRVAPFFRCVAAGARTAAARKETRDAKGRRRHQLHDAPG